jgi:type IV pilus assembly protein PilO
MSAQRHAIAIVLMMSVLGCAGWFGLVAPRLRAIEAAEREEARLKAEFAVLNRLAVNLDLYREQLQALDERFGALLRALPLAEQLISAAGQQDVESRVQSAANSLGLQSARIRAERAFAAENLATQRYDIEAAGDYRQLVRFVQAISTGSGRFWTIQRAVLQPAETGPGLKLAVSLQVHAFLQPAPLPASNKDRK